MNQFERNIVVKEIETSSGRIFPAAFFREKRKNPLVEGHYEYHNLVRGIYKPNGCDLALSVLQVQSGPYSDSLLEDKNGWRLKYLQQGKGKSGWDNVSLQRCIESSPIAVIVQVATKSSRNGSSYKIQGLGRVESYDESEGSFTISQWRGELSTVPLLAPESDVQRAANQIVVELTKPFKPFEDRRMTTIKRIAREEAFSRSVLGLYKQTCAVCDSRWIVNGLPEAEAAHIIPKSRNGSDDPRNGISLCRFHHWSFDRGILAITDDYQVIVSSKVTDFSDSAASLSAIAGKKLMLPNSTLAFPDRETLRWHREHVYLG